MTVIEPIQDLEYELAEALRRVHHEILDAQVKTHVHFRDAIVCLVEGPGLPEDPPQLHVTMQHAVSHALERVTGRGVVSPITTTRLSPESVVAMLRPA